MEISSVRGRHSIPVPQAEAPLQPLRGTKVADSSGDIVLVGVHGAIQFAHVLDGKFSGEVGEGRAERRESL